MSVDSMERLFWGTIFAIAGALGLLFVLSARASGEVDYCFIEMNTSGHHLPEYVLNGHRVWRPDRYLGVYRDLDAAIQGAAGAGCKVK